MFCSSDDGRRRVGSAMPSYARRCTSGPSDTSDLTSMSVRRAVWCDDSSYRKSYLSFHPGCMKATMIPGCRRSSAELVALCSAITTVELSASWLLGFPEPDSDAGPRV